MRKLEFLSDAEWTENLDHSKSSSGFCFKLSSSSADASWSTKVQICVATATAVAEINSLVEATKEAIHFKDLLQDLAIEIQKPIEIFIDNQACIALSKLSTHYGKTKHFALRLHFIRELAERRELELKYLQTVLMIADALTKELGNTKHAKFYAALLGDTQPEMRGEESQERVRITSEFWFEAVRHRVCCHNL